MYDSFTIGNLHQVSRETYVVHVSCSGDIERYSCDPQLCDVSFKDGPEANLIDNKGVTMVVLQKGQQIPNTELAEHFNMKFRKSKEYEKGDKNDLVLGMLWRHHNNVNLYNCY